jgi:hypothetical protein
MAGSRREGAALIITLAFMILLAAILVIFFTQALSYRQQSNGSFNDFKSATIGQSALETVVGDLVQEMTNGSPATIYNQGGTNVVYNLTSLNNTNAVPQRSGNPPLVSGADQTPNLIRISVRNDPISFPGVGSRASADSSTNVVSAGQYISLARWNKHYLLPRGTSSSGVALAGTTNLDTTPISAFSPPDWVYVKSDTGPTVITAPTTKVIGRYAYAIYDEGGLLDANVAGVPSNTQTNAAYPATGSNPNLLVWGSGHKGSEAFADLTVPNPQVPGKPILTQPQIDQLVGWRNNATIQPTGTFGGSTGNPLTASGYTIGTTGAVNYHDAMVLNTNGFLLTSGATYTDGTSGKTDTDQAFVNRQALISFFQNAGLPQDSLQYFATFTRALEQPSYNPPVGRPMVQNNTNSAANVAPFGTGNDAYGYDRASTTTNSPTDINPPLLAVRVGTSFTRADGTTAQIGEPLLKERFPLSRLKLLTSSAYNFSTPPSSGADNDPIYKYFGLYRGSAGVAWKYNHDPAITAGGIDRLSAVAALSGSVGTLSEPREPDFFELLKAAIDVGSLGKGACYNAAASASNNPKDLWTTGGTQGNLQQAHDNLTALQILQIGANIIDQSKSDNFPTRIQFTGDTSNPVNEVRGAEDLPYLYRMRNWLSGYVNSSSNSTNIAFFVQPELWNPNSIQSTNFVSSTATPSKFQVVAEPDPTSTATPLNATVVYGSGSSYSLNPVVSLNSPNYSSYTSTTPNPAPLGFSAGELNNFWGFREPTLLAVTSMPASAHLATTSYTDMSFHANMTGLLISTFSMWYNGLQAWKFSIVPSTDNASIRYLLQYQDSSGNWITYDEAPFEFQSGATSFDVHTINFLYTTYANAEASYDYFGGVRTDPRTSRWGYFYGQFLNSLPIVDASNNEYGSHRVDGTIGYGTHQGSRNDLGFVGTYGTYGRPWQGFEHGYWAENSVRPTYQTDSGDPGYRYDRDPDGVARRAIGGYVTDTASGGIAISANESIIGQPMAIASGSVSNNYPSALTSSANTPNYSSRPTILHRPFRSVAELGYAFRDTPWGNINFSFPESGDSPLLDVFCINDTGSTQGLVAGRVDLNTRQAPVLASLVSGVVRDKDDSSNPVLTAQMASDLANRLVTRTMATTSSITTQGPLLSRADLVGTWMGAATPAAAKISLTAAPPDPNTFFTGFSYDIGTLSSVSAVPNLARITRQRDSVIRALVDSGTTRTWNLLIDLVAQSGRFPSSATGFSNFVVEGEKHYWLHVAIDRYTGKILDSQLEVVKE